MDQDGELLKATTLKSNAFEGVDFIDVIRVSLCNI